MTASRRQFLRLLLLVGMFLAVLAFVQLEARTEALIQIRFRYKWLFVLALFTAAFAVQAWLFLKPSVLEILVARRLPRSLLLKGLGVVLFLGGLLLCWPARFAPLSKLDPILGVTLFMVWGLILLQSLGIVWLTGLKWEGALIAALLADGLVFQVYAIFQPVTQYPFSLGWSEASRYFYGSLPFSRSLYGENLPLSFLHGTRYLMLAVPFLIKGLPLWADRLWQALLWLGVTGLTAWLAVRRLGKQPRSLVWMLTAWFFLFFFQGVVYYHLQVCVILVLAGVSSRRPSWTLAAVLAASFWAGMSRLNWFPVPAMLAIALYLLEQPVPRPANLRQYLVRPALWTVCGLAAALLGQAFYIAISGNSDLAAFGSSLTSDLLWYRLLPNDTYAFGVLPGILLVTLPAAAYLYHLRAQIAALHPLRLWGLIVMLVVLFAGGLVVSVKIGGGGDLHNMDAYLVLLALIVLYFVGGRVALDGGGSNEFQPSPAYMLLLALVPVGLAFLKVTPPIHYDAVLASQDLSSLGRNMQHYARSGPVLFMYERHLLTFRLVPEVPLANDYEVVTLMEMAISGNQPYLEGFYRDIDSHRFAAVLMRKSNLAVNAGDFVEENNAWNRLVAYPLSCEYEPALTLESSNIQVLVPRMQRECPVITEGGGNP